MGARRVERDWAYRELIEGCPSLVVWWWFGGQPCGGTSFVDPTCAQLDLDT